MNRRIKKKKYKQYHKQFCRGGWNIKTLKHNGKRLYFYESPKCGWDTLELEQIKTPMLDKIADVSERSRICREFLDFLLEGYDVFDRSRPEPYQNGNYDKEKLLAEFFEIDLEQAEKERQLLFELFVD